ncbi:MAG: hypothetical protein HY519_03330 [Candidatus Aenigmarchaeota archaeon]|nr:hypothetical protein [Candidatus Aenigmarchaeota archaeon]
MPIERMPAKKVQIGEVTSANWVKMEGFEPSFVETPAGERISRARILATVVAKFIAEDGNFAAITLDDGTDTIRAKCWKDIKVAQPVNVGDTVDAVGKVREYNGEIYLNLESAYKVTDPNMELLRRAEILQRAKSPSPPQEQKTDEKEAIRKKVIAELQAAKEGVFFDDLAKKIGNEAVLEKAVEDLLAEGICYEPSPGKIRKI